MEGQANEGKLVLAGPFTIDGARRGIVVYRVADEAEARRRGEADPMIKAGRLALELHAWQVPIGALPVTGKVAAGVTLWRLRQMPVSARRRRSGSRGG